MALIMVADDTPEIVALLTDVLAARGHQVVSVTDGVQLIEKAKDWRPHLMIVDIMMPGAYGTAAMKSLRDDPTIAATPVVFLTAVDPDKARKLVQEDARTKILFKPLDVGTLMKAIEGLLSASKSPS